MAKLHKRPGDDAHQVVSHHSPRRSGNRSIISENKFNSFADVHATMKRNEGKIFVVTIPKTAKPMKIQAFHDLKQSGYAVEAR